jgi:hypothetical protein
MFFQAWFVHGGYFTAVISRNLFLPFAKKSLLNYYVFLRSTFDNSGHIAWRLCLMWSSYCRIFRIIKNYCSTRLTTTGYQACYFRFYSNWRLTFMYLIFASLIGFYFIRKQQSVCVSLVQVQDTMGMSTTWRKRRSMVTSGERLLGGQAMSNNALEIPLRKTLRGLKMVAVQTAKQPNCTVDHVHCLSIVMWDRTTPRDFTDTSASRSICRLHYCSGYVE